MLRAFKLHVRIGSFSHYLEVSHGWSLPEIYRLESQNKTVAPYPNEVHQSLPAAVPVPDVAFQYRSRSILAKGLLWLNWFIRGSAGLPLADVFPSDLIFS